MRAAGVPSFFRDMWDRHRELDMSSEDSDAGDDEQRSAVTRCALDPTSSGIWHRPTRCVSTPRPLGYGIAPPTLAASLPP